MSWASPCDSCQEEYCPCGGCDAWKKRYHIRQRQINAYARRVGQAQAVECWCYAHPDEYRRWLKHGPCRWCQARDHCDAPCLAYQQWWDERMRRFRRIFT